VTTADLTVAVATLDRPQGLARCLEALAAGTVQPAEVIVVDQGREPAPVMESGLPVRYLRQERRGLAASRNLALAEASRPVLAVTDDDCVPDVGWVAALEQAFGLGGGSLRSLPPGRGRVGSGGRLGGGSSEGDKLAASAQPPPPSLPPFPTTPSQGGGTHPPDAVTGPVLPLGPEQPGLYAVSSRTSASPADFSGRALPWVVGTGGNFAARRDWLLRAGGFDERLGAGSPGGAGEDMDILYRLLRAGARIRYEPQAVVFHERQPRDRRLASRSSYGRGIGACCGLWLRERDLYALAVLAGWLRMRGGMAAGAVRRRQWGGVREELMVLGGTARGLVYGLRAGRPA
jgi:GT2 family glycosyltransferase